METGKSGRKQAKKGRKWAVVLGNDQKWVEMGSNGCSWVEMGGVAQVDDEGLEIS